MKDADDDDILSDAPSEVSLANIDDNDDFSEDDRRSIQAPVESLVAGRERRSTAGNRLATLLHQEADAEDTLFLEDEDDVEFAAEFAEELSDVQLDSSSDDEYDAGPPAVDVKDGEEREEELEGERELERQVKEAKAVKKRKAAEAFLKPRISTRKRVTIKDVTSTTTTATTTAAQTATATPPATNSPPRPRKKSERVSWIPEFAAVRSSSRTLSLQNRTETMKRLEESEKRRLHTIKLMEAAAAKKDKTNPRKVMTQADRLREAKLTEQMNLKSLNRWEQNEAYRLEEQRRKLAALQNRRLVGPVITWWSGTAEWDESGKLVRVGRGLVDTIQCASNEEGKKDKGKDCKRKFKINQEKGKEKATSESEGNLEQEGNEMQQHATIIIAQPGQYSAIQSPQLCSTSPSRPTSSTSDNINPAPSSDTAPLAPPPPAPQTQVIRNNGVLPMFLEGILDYAALPDPSEQKGPPPEKNTDESTPPTPPSLAERPKPKTEKSTRNVVVLGNFDPPAVQTREGVVKVLFPSESKRSWRESYFFSTHPVLLFRVVSSSSLLYSLVFVHCIHDHSQFLVPKVRSGPSLTRGILLFGVTLDFPICILIHFFLTNFLSPWLLHRSTGIPAEHNMLCCGECLAFFFPTNDCFDPESSLCFVHSSVTTKRCGASNGITSN